MLFNARQHVSTRGRALNSHLQLLSNKFFDIPSVHSTEDSTHSSRRLWDRSTLDRPIKDGSRHSDGAKHSRCRITYRSLKAPTAVHISIPTTSQDVNILATKLPHRPVLINQTHLPANIYATPSSIIRDFPTYSVYFKHQGVQNAARRHPYQALPNRNRQPTRLTHKPQSSR